MAVNMIFIYVVHCLIRFRKIIESKNGWIELKSKQLWKENPRNAVRIDSRCLKKRVYLKLITYTKVKVASSWYHYNWVSGWCHQHRNMLKLKRKKTTLQRGAMSRSNNNTITTSSLGSLACDAINKNPITNFNQRQKQQVFSPFVSFRFWIFLSVDDCLKNRIGMYETSWVLLSPKKL